MLGVGLCLKQYGFNDGTQAALVLANSLSARADMRVSLFSTSEPKIGSNRLWDRSVTSADREPFEKWVERNDVIVWFHLSRSMLRLAKKQKNKRHILVLSWNEFTTTDSSLIKQFDKVVVSEEPIDKWFKEYFPTIETAVIPWCSGVSPVRKRASSADRVSILLPLTSSSSEKYGPLLFYVLEDMMQHYGKLKVSIMYNRTTDANTWKIVSRISKEKKDRLELIYRPNLLERLHLYELCDWTFWPSVCEDTGITGLESLSCGTPVIGLDIPVVSNVVKNGRNGLLVGCDIEETALKVPFAYPKLYHLVDGLENVLSSKFLFDDVMGEDWPDLNLRSTAFHDNWCELLGVGAL